MWKVIWIHAGELDEAQVILSVAQDQEKYPQKSSEEERRGGTLVTIFDSNIYWLFEIHNQWEEKRREECLPTTPSTPSAIPYVISIITDDRQACVGPFLLYLFYFFIFYSFLSSLSMSEVGWGFGEMRCDEVRWGEMRCSLVVAGSKPINVLLFLYIKFLFCLCLCLSSLIWVYTYRC